jgi:hypothetical protein
MRREVTPISLATDQAHGSSMARKTVASMTRVSKHLTGAVDLAATFATGLAAGGKAAVEGLGNHMSEVADAMSKLLSGEGMDEPAVEGI